MVAVAWVAWLAAANTLSQKSECETLYWRNVHRREGTLRNAWYESFYTTYFNLTVADYNNKAILDIGCGPRGSLEWADVAKSRVCVDPIARRYGRLGARAHKMVYVQSAAERMPFLDGSFDVVATINSLDHTENPSAVLREAYRVLVHNGLLLIIVESHAKPTPCEPQAFSRDVLLRLVSRDFTVEYSAAFETDAPHCLTKGTESVRKCPAVNTADRTPRDTMLQIVARRKSLV